MTFANLPRYALGLLRAQEYSRPPIVVGGCERSGTTLLQSVISAHPRIDAFAEELWCFCHDIRAGFPPGRPIRMRRLYKYLGSRPKPGDTWRWSEKSPANVFYFQQILEYFSGRVRLVQIVRDGRDVVSSLHPARPNEPWVSVDRWKASVTAGLAFTSDPRVLTIRYEDLVLDYERTARELFAFLDEDFSEKALRWHDHAKIRTSDNLIGGDVHKLSGSSVRKFERPDFPFDDLVASLMADAEARELLSFFDYL